MATVERTKLTNSLMAGIWSSVLYYVSFIVLSYNFHQAFHKQHSHQTVIIISTQPHAVFSTLLFLVRVRWNTRAACHRYGTSDVITFWANKRAKLSLGPLLPLARMGCWQTAVHHRRQSLYDEVSWIWGSHPRSPCMWAWEWPTTPRKKSPLILLT